MVVLTNADRPFIVDADYVTVAGIVFRNGKSLGVPDVGLPGHRGDRFVDDTFAGLIAWSAIDLHGDGHLLAGNVGEVTGSTVGTQGHCYYVSYGSGRSWSTTSEPVRPGTASTSSTSSARRRTSSARSTTCSSKATCCAARPSAQA